LRHFPFNIVFPRITPRWMEVKPKEMAKIGNRKNDAAWPKIQQNHLFNVLRRRAAIMLQRNCGKAP
jgi:hypothetical protein